MKSSKRIVSSFVVDQLELPPPKKVLIEPVDREIVDIPESQVGPLEDEFAVQPAPDAAVIQPGVLMRISWTTSCH